MTDLAATFRQPFKEQVAAFRLRLRNLMPTSRWDDLWQSQHDRAFMVAGAVKADLLADLGAAVDRAISEGTGLEAFRKDFRAIIEKNGWHGWTGEGTEKGEAWRTRVIYRTNMRTSYMAGRYAQLVEGGFKYWIYRHGGSLEPRLNHLAWDGLILEAIHPFWQTHFPPNGWGCSCRVFGSRTMEGAKRKGGDPSVELEDGWQMLDPKTGAPEGVGKGWAYAPGASVAETVNAMAEKTVAWQFELAKAFMADLPEEVADDVARAYRGLPTLRTELRRYVQRIEQDTDAIRQPYRTLGRLTSADAKVYGERLGQDLTGYDFTFSEQAVRHVLNKHGPAAREDLRGQRGVTVTDFVRLAELLNSPDSFQETEGRIRMSKRIGNERLVAIFEPRRKRRMLSLVTMYVMKAAPRY